MIFHEQGTDKNSEIFFHAPSQNAKRMLYYPLAAGHFFCNKEYSVVRKSYNSILFLYVVDGEITLETKDGCTTAAAGEILFVNCYAYHKYYAETFAVTYWLHFDGTDAMNWYQELVKLKGQKSKCSYTVEKILKELVAEIASACPETELSKNIYFLLCETISSDEAKKTDGYFDEIKNYMEKNLSEDMAVDALAKKCNMSNAYFSKEFKKATGLSPYHYLSQLRLSKAQALLRQSNISVQETAYRTGFHSTANFIYFFKKQTGFSPLQFRKMNF